MKAKLIKQRFNVPCDIYACFNRAKYSICNPQGPMNLNMNLCEDCKKSLEESMLGERQQIAAEPEVKHQIVVISEDMKIPELIEIAEKLNIGLKANDTKPEIIEKIRKAGEING